MSIGMSCLALLLNLDFSDVLFGGDDELIKNHHQRMLTTLEQIRQADACPIFCFLKGKSRSLVNTYSSHMLTQAL